MGTDAAKTQQSIDFGNRGQRLRQLDRLQLPDDVKQTSPAAMLTVLRCLDSHARDDKRCRVTASLIAAETNKSRRSVDRALVALEGLYLISRKRTGRSSFYEICWGNLAKFDPKDSEFQTSASGHRDASEWTRCPNRVDTVTTLSRHGDHSTEASSEAQRETPSSSSSKPDAWAEAAKEVGKVCSAWKAAIAAAQGNGVGPDYVLRCVDYFHAAGGAFDRGALFTRLENAADFQPPHEPHTWPKPRPLTTRETSAVELLKRVIAWAESERLGEDAIRRSFRNAATAEGYSPAEVARALFEFQLHELQKVKAS